MNQESLMDLFSSEKPSIILFHSSQPDTSLLNYYNEFNNFAQLLTNSGLEINIGEYIVEDSNYELQSFNLRNLPAIKLILEGRAFEYAGEKTVAELLRHIQSQLSQTVLIITDQRKLEVLINTERTLLVYFTSQQCDPLDTAAMDDKLVKNTFNNLLRKWGNFVRFVIAKDIQELSVIEGFKANNKELVLFRKHSSPYKRYDGIVDSQLISDFLLNNVFHRITEFDHGLYQFIKEEKLACMLLIIKKKGKILVNFFLID